MPETPPAGTAIALAALRASGARTRPDTGPAMTALRAAADRAGRALVDLADGRLVLGWMEDSEPVGGGDTGVVRIKPKPSMALTFLAALRACWPDKDTHPYPGEAVDEEQVLAALATLGPLRDPSGDGTGTERHQKGALVVLRAAGFLDPDTEPGIVRLGPRVAAWSEREVQVLRHNHSRMPTAPRTEESA
jgi:hypothetical protein